MGDTTEYTRLHITPLSASLLPSILPPSVLPNARNITYHTIQTFPDRPYGFLDLPTMDASKLKSKLNGSVLKGQKIKIESAKPNQEFKAEERELEKPKREKKKRGRDEIPGAEIGERNVKRGWTTPGKPAMEDKKKIKSKYTTGKECLFKTILPANVAAKSVDKKKRKGQDTVVHEFEKTTKFPTFLRASVGGSKKKGSRAFVNGKGWVDEDGEIVEAAKGKRGAKLYSIEPPNFVTEPQAEEHISTSESSQESDSEDITAPRKELRVPASRPPKNVSSASISDTSEDSSSEDSSSDDEHLPDPPSTLSTPIKSSRPASSSGLTIKIPDSAISSTPISNTVHPLEALYKKTKITDATLKPAPESFSFFGADNEVDEEEQPQTQDTLPFTPFTQREFEYRGLRSAAPTPDTAHGNKKFSWPTWNSDDGKEEVSSPIRKRKSTVNEERSREEETDFQKWFYEHRGDTSRAWKKRKRDAAKEKRQMENRKRGDRN